MNRHDRRAHGERGPRSRSARPAVADSSEKAGDVNQYVCQTCGFTITTINRAPGVTPMLLSHRYVEAKSGAANAGTCAGRMLSRWYRVEGNPEPTHEFYRPDDEEWQAMRDPEMLDHVEKGGLLFRKIDATRI